MSGFLWRMGGALAVGVLGLILVLWQLEHVSLRAAAGLGRPSPAIYALLLVGWSLMFAYTRWAGFLLDHPETREVPVWLLIGIIVVAAVALILGSAIHASWLAAQDPVPTEISQGVVAYQASFAALALVPAVLLAVRGSRRRRQTSTTEVSS